MKIRYHLIIVCFVTFFLIGVQHTKAQQTSVLDSVALGAVVFDGDTIPARSLDTVSKFCKYTEAQLLAKAKWTRLRNAIYVSYPYAKRAGAVMNDVNAHLIHIIDKEDRKSYIKTREKELKKEFTDPLTNLSVYQGKVIDEIDK